jgi:hypothetical protein
VAGDGGGRDRYPSVSLLGENDSTVKMEERKRAAEINRNIGAKNVYIVVASSSKLLWGIY